MTQKSIWIVTWEGWGDPHDFGMVMPENASTPLQAAKLVEFGRPEDDTAQGYSISEECENQRVPLYVYELKLRGTYDRVPVPNPTHEWVARKT